MKIGVTGHQRRPGLDWEWVRTSLREEIIRLPAPTEGYSSLAEGADQVFASIVLELGGKLCAVIPAKDYVNHFADSARVTYLSLLRSSRVCQLTTPGTDEEAFLRAGCYIVDHVDHLFAVWDERPSAGLGGTADIVKYAQGKDTSITHLNPISRSVRLI